MYPFKIYSAGERINEKNVIEKKSDTSLIFFTHLFALCFITMLLLCEYFAYAWTYSIFVFLEFAIGNC